MKANQHGPSGNRPGSKVSIPVPGMPYGRYADSQTGASVSSKRGFDFIESSPAAGPRRDPEPSYNPWAEQGWAAADEARPTETGAAVPPGEPYPPVYSRQADTNGAYPPFSQPYPSYNPPEDEPYSPYPEEAYPEDAQYPPYPEEEAYPPYPDSAPYPPYAEPGEPEEPYPYPEDGPEGEAPPLPPDQPPAPPRVSEPWRLAILLVCIAGLLFCGAEAYRITQSVVQSDAQLGEFRALYIKENNVDFTRNAVAVALRPAGETYPPTATPVPRATATPTPTARIELNDPLIAAMSAGGLAEGQSVAPSTPTPALRSRLERYPLNPLCVVRKEVETLQADNGDIVGELIIAGILDEIVVQRNNTYYLNHNAMGVNAGYSAVFADENLSFGTPPENILLFGRTSNAGKAFAALKNYVSGGFDFAQRHAFLSFNSLYEEAHYVIFAVIRADSNASSSRYFDYRNLRFATDSEMLSFVQSAKDRSLYNFNVPVAASDRLLTLVTLSDSSDTENLILLCRMLRVGESVGVIEAQ